jgi:hypothetical protein
MNLVIHFNRDRGFEDEALGLARRLFAYFDEEIDSLALIPVVEEDLDLVVDGVVVGSLTKNGRPPFVADARAALSCG